MVGRRTSFKRPTGFANFKMEERHLAEEVHQQGLVKCMHIGYGKRLSLATLRMMCLTSLCLIASYLSFGMYGFSCQHASHAQFEGYCQKGGFETPAQCLHIQFAGTVPIQFQDGGCDLYRLAGKAQWLPRKVSCRSGHDHRLIHNFGDTLQNNSMQVLEAPFPAVEPTKQQKPKLPQPLPTTAPTAPPLCSPQSFLIGRNPGPEGRAR